MPGVSSALAERLTGGRYIEVDIDRDAAARYGMNIDDVQSVITAAVGGETIAETVEGLQRFPISVRYPRELRDSVSDLKQLPIVTEDGRADHARHCGGTAGSRAGRRCCAARMRGLSGWVYVDLRGRDLQSAVEEMQAVVAREVSLPAGYSVSWSGSVRVSGARAGQAQDRRAVHVARDLRAPVSHVPAQSTRRC